MAETEKISYERRFILITWVSRLHVMTGQCDRSQLHDRSQEFEEIPDFHFNKLQGINFLCNDLKM